MKKSILTESQFKGMDEAYSHDLYKHIKAQNFKTILEIKKENKPSTFALFMANKNENQVIESFTGIVYNKDQKPTYKTSTKADVVFKHIKRNIL